MRKYEMKALVAEDNEINRHLMRFLLERLGCQVDLVSDGGEALEVWSPGSHNLVFVDLEMPVVDGDEVSRQIRKKEKEAATLPVPLYILTGHGDERMQQSRQESGATEILGKPLDIEKLRRLISTVVVGEAVSE
ncbi:MAG: hypothetical protein C0621_04860 [Desulfuromonas sp.]|nr:MAG: hypothetical protein C0621_04860 [Desulfuromonas sp.]